MTEIILTALVTLSLFLVSRSILQCSERVRELEASNELLKNLAKDCLKKIELQQSKIRESEAELVGAFKYQNLQRAQVCNALVAIERRVLHIESELDSGVDNTLN